MVILESSGKAKAIHTFMKDAELSNTSLGRGNDEAADPVAAYWPEGENKNKDQKEEDLYGYGDAAPTPRNATAEKRMHRRSSLKASGGQRRASISYTGEMTLTLPTGQTTQKRTSVSFMDSSEVHNIEAVSTLVDDPNRLWFQKEEYAHIQDKIVAIVNHAKKSDGEERDTWLCTRGLEPLLNTSSFYERKEAHDNVIDEQKMQKVQGKHDEEYIRTIYQFHTLESQVVATERADNDAKAVEGYLKFTRKMCRRMSC